LITNPYRTLGVSNFADSETIKKAYRKLALKHHPDKNQNTVHSQRYFSEIKEAYEILSNAEKRKVIDEKLRFSGIQMPKYGQGPYAFNRQNWGKNQSVNSQQYSNETELKEKVPFLKSNLWNFLLKPFLFIAIASMLMYLISVLS